MAHHSATLKSIRQTAKRTERNRSIKGSIRTAVKKVELALVEKNVDSAQASLKVAQKALMSGVSKGVMKQKTASRKLSRLNKNVKIIAGK